jgi:hypothetical protein
VRQILCVYNVYMVSIEFMFAFAWLKAVYMAYLHLQVPWPFWHKLNGWTPQQLRRKLGTLTDGSGDRVAPPPDFSGVEELTKGRKVPSSGQVALPEQEAKPEESEKKAKAEESERIGMLEQALFDQAQQVEGRKKCVKPGCGRDGCWVWCGRCHGLFCRLHCRSCFPAWLNESSAFSLQPSAPFPIPRVPRGEARCSRAGCNEEVWVWCGMCRTASCLRHWIDDSDRCRICIPVIPAEDVIIPAEDVIIPSPPETQDREVSPWRSEEDYEEEDQEDEQPTQPMPASTGDGEGQDSDDEAEAERQAIDEGELHDRMVELEDMVLSNAVSRKRVASPSDMVSGPSPTSSSSRGPDVQTEGAWRPGPGPSGETLPARAHAYGDNPPPRARSRPPLTVFTNTRRERSRSTDRIGQPPSTDDRMVERESVSRWCQDLRDLVSGPSSTST